MKPTRLLFLVPLAMASLGFAEQAPQQPSSAHAWRQSQKTDAANTLTFSRFTLAGKFAASSQGDGSHRPTLAVDCIPGEGPHPPRGKFMAATLLVGSTLKIVFVEPEEIRGTSYFPKVAVRYRADDAKDEEEKWSVGTDKTSASIPKESLKTILRARTVDITAENDGGSPIAMHFDMPDPTLVEASCNVDEHKE
ncbi:MAG: hypothetical protein ABSH33_02360 [Steroidobacteraceae bacterium]|jgi:hypothetical protein